MLYSSYHSSNSSLYIEKKYIRLEKKWSSPEDYEVDISIILERINKFSDKIEKILYEKSDDCKLKQEIPSTWERIHIDK